ncbi:MAG: hypothetical protein KZQ92_19465 [Candidatus Thiodiazotropha sp. (ex Lucinoma borealis)]|nr:hypothetical protein [Candidatus Thiodiazotropha sp. (ex Lucinoma borealis)]MCU7866146.1 hypothetical protein [Candidatus Thiodiazotropha sp. (ex Lucinoma borealis)]MCU7868938.1 hypothetical protein [Candidatus Thiodiazotropha sp. (ex Lucinoma borealis)]
MRGDKPVFDQSGLRQLTVCVAWESVDKLYAKTVSQGRESCLILPRQGMPVGIGRLADTSAIVPSKPF